MEPEDQATEFARRREMPGVEVRRMHSKRVLDVVLSLRGRNIGSKTEVTKRGKVVSTLYVLPTL